MFKSEGNNKNKPLCLAVFCSGGGGNFQYLIDSQCDQFFKIAVLVVDKICGAVERAVQAGIPCIQLQKADGITNYDKVLGSHLISSVDVFVLAGYMPILPSGFIEKAQKRIINTHPSLLPKYGGIGMYGVKVQEAVLSNEETIAGCTVHHVTTNVDAGEIISQKSINVLPGETAWQLGGRIFNIEGPNLIDALKQIQNDCSREVL